MSNWRARAQPVSGWKARAQSVDAIEAAPAEKEVDGFPALEGFGQGAAMGYLPHLQAAASRLMPDPNAALDAKLRSQGFTVQGAPQTTYVEERDANIARMKRMAEENPVRYYGGQVGGLLATAPGIAKYLLPAAGEGAGLLSKVGYGALAGGVQGGLINPGDREGEVNVIQGADRLENAGVGALVGGAIPAVVEGAKGLKGLLSEKAAKKAARAVGRPTPSQAARMAESGEDVALGRTLLDEKAIPILGTPKRIQGRIEALREKTWQGVDDLLSRGTESVPGVASPEGFVDGTAVGMKLLDSPDLALLRKTPGAESTVAAMEKAAETLSNAGRMTLKEAQALKRSIDKQINYAKAIPDMTGGQQARFAARTGLRDQMDSTVADLGAGKGALKAAFKKQGLLEKAADIAEREAGRQQANRAVSLTDTIAAATGIAGGGPVTGLIMGALNKAGRTFGNSLQARGYDAAAKGIGLLPLETLGRPEVGGLITRGLLKPKNTPAADDIPPIEEIRKEPSRKIGSEKKRKGKK